jgi:erythromycin esterase-like protein
MLNETTILLTDVVREAAHPLVGEIDDYDPLMKLIGDAPLVLIGEASHGTHEFYRERAQIAKRLIKEKGFIHFDETRAVEPLELTAEWEAGEVPETFPTGI